MKQRLIIPCEFPDLNSIIDNSKTHWSRYSQPKKGYNIIVAAYARQQLKPVDKYPINVTCYWFCKDKRKDPDGISVGVKFIFDGLRKSGIISGDGWAQINSIHHFFVVDTQCPRVEVELEY